MEKTMARRAAAVSKRGAVQVIDIAGALHLGRFCPKTLEQEELEVLFVVAAGKLGWRRDRRCRSGWRKARV